MDNKLNLDLLAEQYGWKMAKVTRATLSECMAILAHSRPTALILEVDDEGTRALRDALPEHITIFENIGKCKFYCRKNDVALELIICVSPQICPTQDIPVIQYFPPCLSLGVGCQKMAPAEIAEQMLNDIRQAGYAPESIACIGTIDIKKEEPMLSKLQRLLPDTRLGIFTADELNKVKIPNPSDRVFEATGCYGVAEASALLMHKGSHILVEKQKGKAQTSNGKIAHYTWALAKFC